MKKKDNNEFLSKSNKLLTKLNEDNPDVRVISEVDPFYALRVDILYFFRQIMDDVKKKETLKDKLEQSFLDDLNGESEEVLTFQNKMSLYKLISTQSNIASEGILSLFKPTPGAPSLLAENISRDEKEDNFEKVYNEMSSDDLQNFQKFIATMDSFYRKTKEKEEEEES